eukprot:1150676-Pelagomonas_calceolata.AAC.1
MMTPDCFDVLYKAFRKTKALGLHSSICPSPASFASELIGLLARKTQLEKTNIRKKGKKLCRQCDPSPHQLRKRRHIGSKDRESPSPEVIGKLVLEQKDSIFKLKTPFHGHFHLIFTMLSKIGHMPPKRKWPLPWTITLIIYTTGGLTPMTFFMVPNTIPSHHLDYPDSWGFPSATSSVTTC